MREFIDQDIQATLDETTMNERTVQQEQKYEESEKFTLIEQVSKKNNKILLINKLKHKRRHSTVSR